LLACTIALPWSIRRRLYARFLGWHLAPTARIGFSYVDADRLTMAAGSRIGHLNVIRNLRILEIGEGSLMGQWNWLTVASEFDEPAPPSGGFRGLRLGNYVAIVSRHYLDCSGGITIGDNTLIAGVRSTFLTHQVDTEAGTYGTLPISIGEFCLVSANVCFTPGSVLPARSVVAMGAVVTGTLEVEGALYGGVPARVIRTGIGGGRYFSRERGNLPVSPDDRRGGGISTGR
jgi:acetyltransferase-like isoleucine patch superfamily enzyme